MADDLHQDAVALIQRRRGIQRRRMVHPVTERPNTQPRQPDPKIKPGTGERDHRLGLFDLSSRDGERCGQAAGSRVTL